MTKIKICGLTSEYDIEAVNEYKPEYIGFVFAAGSRRRIDADRAAALRTKLDPSVTAVGVFVDQPLQTVTRLLDDSVIDMAQLHGHESEEYIRSLRQRTGRTIIKAFTAPDGCEAAERSGADFVLLDSGAGSGRVFDWKYLKNMTRPYFLAGGLHAANVAEAIRMLAPYAVDASTGVEYNGKKSADKIREFIWAARNAPRL